MRFSNVLRMLCETDRWRPEQLQRMEATEKDGPSVGEVPVVGETAARDEL